MLKKINKKVIYIIIVLTLTLSLIVGLSWINSSYTLASGTVNLETQACLDAKLYDRIACMSVLDEVQSKYVDSAIKFNDEISTKSSMDNDSNIKRNGHGIYELTRTINDNYPIYYYRGDKDLNNNIKFGGFCWKIVRTTSTGGTKIIYNGEPNANGSCSDDESDEHSIGNSSFGSNNSDYMKESNESITKYISVRRKNISIEKSEFNLLLTNNYVLSDSYEYVDGKYKLINSTHLNADSIKIDLTGSYACSLDGESTITECDQLYYIYMSTPSDEEASNTVKTITLKNGNDVSQTDKTILLANGYIDNGNGTFTLEDPTTIKYTEWAEKANLNYSYTCLDENATCSNLASLVSLNDVQINYRLITDKVTFGKSISYDGNNYTLNNTKEVWDFSRHNYDEVYSLYSYDYSLYGLSDNTSVYYIRDRYYRSTNEYLYFKADKLTDGNMHITRTVDTPIKETIDNWYSNNLSTYTNKIEDTVYCNDTRNYKVIKGRPPVIYSDALRRMNTHQVDLDCSDEGKYTVDNSNGNGLLSYPIGLLSLDEAIMTGISKDDTSKSFLNFGNTFYLMTPGIINDDVSTITDEEVSRTTTDNKIRPVISLSNSIQINSGTGTLADPYIVS